MKAQLCQVANLYLLFCHCQAPLTDASLLPPPHPTLASVKSSTPQERLRTSSLVLFPRADLPFPGENSLALQWALRVLSVECSSLKAGTDSLKAPQGQVRSARIWWTCHQVQMSANSGCVIDETSALQSPGVAHFSLTNINFRDTGYASFLILGESCCKAKKLLH